MNPMRVDALSSAAQRVQALRAALQAGESGPVRLIETHISWVLLTAAWAYKLKKPVKLPFVDFSSLALRRHCCEEELRLNGRLAPTLYLDVVDVCDGPDGPHFGGPGPVVDVAVRMRRFPDGALWSEMLAAGTLLPGHIDAMAQRLATFHRAAAAAPQGSHFGSAASHQHILDGVIEAVDAMHQTTVPGSDATAGADWPALRAWLGQQMQALAPLWAARQRAGCIRECHADLHLANVLQLDGQATAFDGIEFNAELRWIDVQDDIAFLAMDLLAHGRRDLAFRFINACLAHSGDYAGLPALRFHLVCRALVRARVTAIGDLQRAERPSSGKARAAAGAAPGSGKAAQYLALACALSTGADARLALTHGLPGSGKSFVSQALVEAVGGICVRSDVERKRLFGLGALQSSRGLRPAGIYDPATTRRTYARLRAMASVALQAGWPVVVDAAFLRASERAHFAALAAAHKVPFCIFDCRADLAVLRGRLAGRQAQGADASEADAAVLDHLVGVDQGLSAVETGVAIAVDAAHPVAPAVLAGQWLQAG